MQTSRITSLWSVLGLFLATAVCAWAQAGPSARPEAGQVIVRFKDNVGAEKRELIAQRHGLRMLPPKGKARIQPFGSQRGKPHLLEVAEGKDPQAVSELLARSADVLYAEPNYAIELAAATRALPVRPNDFDFGRLWGLENTAKPGADIHAVDAWRRHTGSSNVVVAVIDTGIDFLHPDLAANVWVNPAEIPHNGLDDDGNGFIDDAHGFDFVSHDSDPFDDHGHGTHVSGTIGAVGNNGIGIAGVCWEIRLMGLKAMDENGSGTLYSAIEAIEYAVARGARIINASWGLKESSRALREAVASAVSQGVIFIAAAGNDRTHAPFYPAAFDGVISVAATTEEDTRASFTNFGETVDVSAPGASIYSTLPDASYGFQGGTSMAAPHVSGLAALILSAHPEFTASDVEGIILNTADEFESTQPMGVGRINAGRAMSHEEPLPIAELAPQRELFGQVDIRGSAHGHGFAEYKLEIGAGPKPSHWIVVAESSVPLTNSNLAAGFDTRNLAEGEHLLRLSVYNARGAKAVAARKVMVENVKITSPLSSDIRRSGEAMRIFGRVAGQGREYKMYWSEGLHPQLWKTNGIEITADAPGSEIARWDTSVAASNQFHALRLVATAASGKVDEEIVHMVYLDGLLRAGFPRRLSHELLPQDEWRSLKAADLDGDGRQEIILTDPGIDGARPARLIVMSADGELEWSRELDADPPYADEPVIGDVDGDGQLEIFAGGGGHIHGFKADGSTLPGWPARLRGQRGGKALADLDGDGKLELIIQSEDWSGGSGVGVLKVYRAEGGVRAEWTFALSSRTFDTTPLVPAIGNMDDDPELEIVAVTGHSQVSLFDARVPNFPIWSTPSINYISSSPVLGDLNGDGRLEIVVGRTGDVSDGKEKHPGGLHAYDQNGRPLFGWPACVDEYFPHTAALADFDKDGLAEVVAASFPRGKLHVINFNGFELPGWPIELVPTGSGNVMPSIGDVNADGQADILVAQPGYWLGAAYGNNLAEVSGVRAWSVDGREIDLNPGPLPGLPFENSGQPWHKASPPLITDLDGNGRVDLLTASLMERTYRPMGFAAQRKERSAIYAWELAAPFTVAPWPAHHQNARQSGALPPFIRTNSPPVLSPMPAQKIVAGNAFAPLPLTAFVSDANDPIDRLGWEVEAGPLAAQINERKELEVSAPAGWTGEALVRLTARDPHGARASAQARYTAAAAGPVISLPTMSFNGREDEALEIQLPLPAAISLALAGRPLHGTLEVSDGSALNYTPAPNYFGPDEFLVVVRDPLGFTAFTRAAIALEGINDPPTAFPDQVVTDEDTPIEIDPLANDRDPETNALSIVSVSRPQNGEASIQGSRVVYTPKLNFFGTDTFRYIVRDSEGLASEGVISVHARPVNDAPILTNQTFTVRRNSRLNFEFPGRDPEGDRLRYSVTKPPAHGDLWMQPTLADYYPLKGFVGSDSFTYVASDGQAVSAPATVTIQILGENNPPKTPVITVGTRSGKALEILLEATDEDLDPLGYELVSQPENGVVTGTPPRLLYTPHPSFAGTNRFEYAATDPHGGRTVGEVVIIVKTGNSAPYAVFTHVTLKMNSSTNFTLQSFDEEGDPLEFAVLSQPVNGVLSGAPPHLTYTPNPNYLGPDRFTFGVSDGALSNAFPGEVFISVLSTNLPPEAKDQATAVAAGQTVRGALDILDAESDPIRCVIAKGPRHGTIAISGTNFIYRASAAFPGSDSFTYRPWDGHKYGNVATVRIGPADPVPELPLAFTAISRAENGEVALTFTGPMGENVRIEASPDLRSWEVIHSQVSSGTNRFMAPPFSQSQLFFRLNQP